MGQIDRRLVAVCNGAVNGLSRARFAARSLLASLALLGGCYESNVPLGPAERNAIDPELLGTWTCKREAEPAKGATLLVVAYDASRYYLEWRDPEETTRWAAHSSIVGGALLYNVRELKPDGRATKWVFLRALTPADSQLRLALVKGEPLKDLGEAQALAELRRRASDESLYEPWASCKR